MLASLASASPAFAQTKEAPAATEGPDKESTRLYEEGVKAAKAGQWEKARLAMLAAFTLRPSHARAANLGRVELMAARPREAAEHLSYFLQGAPGIESDDRKAAEAMLAEARAKIAVVTIQTPSEGAEVLIDDVAVGRAPLPTPLFLDPGAHKVVLRVEGRPEVAYAITLKAGSMDAIALDAAVPTTPAAPVRAPPLPAPEKSKAIVFGGAGLAVATLGAGIAFTVISNEKALDADMQLARLKFHGGSAPCKGGISPTECATLLSTNRSSDTFHNLAVVGYAAAGIAAVGTLAYALWPSKKAAPRTGLVVIPAMGGILVHGGF
jgi:hypothetical protein